jgi:predicted porin
LSNPYLRKNLTLLNKEEIMKQLHKYLVLALVAVPLVGFTGGYVTNPVIKSNEAVAAQGKKGSSAKVYGRLWTQYSNEKTSGGNAQTAIMDDEGMARVGIKGKSSIGNGYAVNYKVEWAIDLGDGDASGLKESSTTKSLMHLP